MITINYNVISPLAKSVSIPLGLTAAASAADTGIQKNLRDNLLRTKEGPYLMNLYVYSDIETLGLLCTHKIMTLLILIHLE